MSLDFLDEQIDGFRTKAAGLIDGYAQTQAEVAADHTLTDVGKREALEPLHDEVSAAVTALRTAEKAAITRKREALEKQLFGMNGGSTDVVLYRDAQDRAARLTSQEEAQELYTRALRSDDKSLAQAVLGQSLTYNWLTVIDDYKQRNPDAAIALTDLTKVGQYENNGFMGLMHYAVPGLSTAQPMRIR